MSGHILVVDDERNIRIMLGEMLELADYSVDCVEDGEAALARCAEGGVDLVLLDVMMSGMDGLTVLQKLRERWPEILVIMMSGHGSIETAVRAVRAGASDFLEKPLGRDATLLTIESALRLRSLARENQRMRESLRGGAILGESSATRELVARIGQVAPSNARVLIEGESGSGKELVARALHEASARSDNAFIALNCAAIPSELIESELFGHTRGAFTGAVTARVGVFEAANGGTLFLDEVGDMPMAAQAKLLRVLESGELTRVGATRSQRVDVRVLAATHRDLAVEIQRGGFREDLYHRLNVVPLRVAPLRERLDDVPILARAFLDREAAQQKLGPLSFDAEALKELGRYNWPGNVRELRNFVERLAIFAKTPRIDAAFVRAEFPSAGDAVSTLKDAVESAERAAIRAALEGAGANVSEAARRLGLERSHLYKKARSLGIALREDPPEDA